MEILLVFPFTLLSLFCLASNINHPSCHQLILLALYYETDLLHSSLLSKLFDSEEMDNARTNLKQLVTPKEQTREEIEEEERRLAEEKLLKKQEKKEKKEKELQEKKEKEGKELLEKREKEDQKKAEKDQQEQSRKKEKEEREQQKKEKEDREMQEKKEKLQQKKNERAEKEQIKRTRSQSSANSQGSPSWFELKRRDTLKSANPSRSSTIGQEIPQCPLSESIPTN